MLPCRPLAAALVLAISLAPRLAEARRPTRPSEPAPVPSGLPEAPPTTAVLPIDPSDGFAAALWPARPFQGTLAVLDVAGSSVQAVEARLGEKRLHFHALQPGVLRGLGAVPEDTPPGPTTLELTVRLAPAAGGEGRTVTRSIPIEVEAVDFDHDELRVDPRFTKLSPAARRRVAADKARISAMWARGSAEQPLFRGNFLKPREDRTTAPFGTRRIFNGKRKSIHAGWDIDGEVGEPVLCDNDGVVTLAADLYYSGGSLFVDHGGGLYTAYFHLDSFDVKEGDRVARGQLCGRVGKTGRVTGPHLHWAAKVNGSYVHPGTLLRFDFERPMVPVPASAGGGAASVDAARPVGAP